MCAENAPRCWPKILTVFQEYFTSWRPDLFHRVNLDFQTLSEQPDIDGEEVCLTCFTGGIDSMYTVLDSLSNHSGENPKVTHAIMAGGLDLYLEDRQNFEETFCIYEDLLRQLDIPLIKAATNIYSFSEYRINWRLFYSPATVSLGHLLSRRVKKFLLPTTGQAGVVRYYGSSTPVTYLFGSETVGVINHGFGVDRMTKLDALMDWPVSHHVFTGLQ